jgi:hypothetical protein
MLDIRTGGVTRRSRGTYLQRDKPSIAFAEALRLGVPPNSTTSTTLRRWRPAYPVESFYTLALQRLSNVSRVFRAGSAVPALLEPYASSPFELPALIALVRPHHPSLPPDELSCSGPGPVVEEQPDGSSSPPLQNQPQQAPACLSPTTSTRNRFTAICLPPTDVIPCSGGYLVVRHPRRHAKRGPSPIARPAAAAMRAPQPSRQPQTLLLPPSTQLHSPSALWQASRPQSPARDSPASIALHGVPVGQLPRTPTPSVAFQVALAIREHLAHCRQSMPQPLPLPALVGDRCGGTRSGSSRRVGFGQAPALPSPFAAASEAGQSPTPFAFQEAGRAMASAVGRTLELTRASQQLAAQGAHAPKQPGAESIEAAMAAPLLQRLAAARRQLLLQRLRGALAQAPVAQGASCTLAAWPQGCCPQQQQ